MDFLNMFGNDQSLLAEIIANQKRLAKSANYQFSYMALRKFFYLMDFSLEDFIKNPKELKNLIEIALSYCTKELKIKMPVGYRDLPVYKVSMFLKNAYGYIIAFDDVKNEVSANCSGSALDCKSAPNKHDGFETKPSCYFIVANLIRK